MRASHAYAINGVKRLIPTTVFTRLRADRGHAPIAALIADLARRSDQWGQPNRPLTPTTTTRRRGRRARCTPTSFAPTPLTGDLARINDAWAAALGRSRSPNRIAAKGVSDNKRAETLVAKCDPVFRVRGRQLKPRFSARAAP